MMSTGDLFVTWVGLAVTVLGVFVYILVVAADVEITDRKRAKQQRRWGGPSCAL